MQTHGILPRWIRVLQMVCWGIYAVGIVLFIVSVGSIVSDTAFQMMFFRGITGGPPTWLIVLIGSLCVLALITFSLLPFTSINSLASNFRKGGRSALRQTGIHIWILAVIGQIVAWLLLATLVALAYHLFSVQEIYQLMVQRGPEALLMFISILMALGPVLLLSFLLVPATPLIAVLVFLFRAARRDRSSTK